MPNQTYLRDADLPHYKEHLVQKTHVVKPAENLLDLGIEHTNFVGNQLREN